MKRWREVLGSALHACGGALVSFAVWTLWLALAFLLVIQIYIASTNQLALPGFVLRGLKGKLDAAGVQANLAHTSFDPAGRVLIRDAQLSLPQFPEPIVTASAVYVRLDFVALLLGRFEPREIRLLGATASIPAILSPSGQPEAVIRDFDATLTLDEHQIQIDHLSGRVAGIAMSARGIVPLPRQQTKAPAALGNAVQTFPILCRRVIDASAKIALLDSPSVDLVFEPAESGAAAVNATLFARGLKVEQPVAVQARRVVASTRILMLGGTPAISQLEFETDELELPYGTRAQGVHAAVFGRLQPGGGIQFEPRELALRADLIESSGFGARGVSAQLFPRPFPRLDGSITANVMGAPLHVRAEADLTARDATLQFTGALSPTILDALGQRLHVDVRKYFDFAALDVGTGEARFGTGWKFERLTAETTLRRINAYGVVMDEGRATVELTPGRFYSPSAYARIGDNFARGTYEHDLKTQQYRFLLDGRLRPMDISGWFHEWWPNFFKQLEFPVAPPDASVDVHGMWRDSRQAAVFVFADVNRPVIRGAAFDRARTRLFIRPGYFDGPEMFATKGNGVGRGTFTLALDSEAKEWRSFDLGLDSTLDLALLAKLAGNDADRFFGPFHLSAPPTLKLQGHFDGPDTPNRHRELRIEASSAGEFRFHDFPVQDVRFKALLHDDDVTVDDVHARFAGGTAAGRAKLSGPATQRRLGFDFTLADAHLGEAAAALQDFFATQQKGPRAPAGKFVQEKANVRIDFAASADGLYADPMSYHGGGNATLRGAEIGEVPLLGLLSELLKFTALRFTSAQANFKIEGPKLVFSEVALRGANSAIDAHGNYALDRHQLDFNARIYPFQESGNLLKTVVGAVLTPLSNVFEVKLTGSLEKPQWAFVIGPTNIIRSLNPDTEPAAAPAAGAAPATTTAADPAGRPPVVPRETPPPNTPK